jgi:hypothetical protein
VLRTTAVFTTLPLAVNGVAGQVVRKRTGGLESLNLSFRNEEVPDPWKTIVISQSYQFHIVNKQV